MRKQTKIKEVLDEASKKVASWPNWKMSKDIKESLPNTGERPQIEIDFDIGMWWNP